MSNALCNYVYANTTHGQDKLNVLDAFLVVVLCLSVWLLLRLLNMHSLLQITKAKRGVSHRSTGSGGFAGQALCVADRVLGSTGAREPRAKTMVPEAAAATARWLWTREGEGGGATCKNQDTTLKMCPGACIYIYIYI